MNNLLMINIDDQINSVHKHNIIEKLKNNDRYYWYLLYWKLYFYFLLVYNMVLYKKKIPTQYQY